MRVQSAWALLFILRFCSELFSLLSGALMGFSTRRTLIMKTVEAASIHPSIAQEPLDSCKARLINGRHSRSLPFGAGRELENSALGHLTLPATSASFGAFLPPGPEVPSRKVAAGGLSALRSRFSTWEQSHSRAARVSDPAGTRARPAIRTIQEPLEEQPRHLSLAKHQIPFGYVDRVNFSTTIRFTAIFAYLSGSMLKCKTARCLGVAWGGLATWCS